MADLSFQQGLQLLESRTKITVVAVWSVIALSVVTTMILLYAHILDSSIASTSDSPAQILLVLSSLLWSITYLASAIIVGMWIYRAHANLLAAGYHDLEFTPGWSVGWFFVPFANLFKPFQAMRELVNVSAGASYSFDQETPGPVKAWWACHLIANIINLLVSLETTLAGGQGVLAAVPITSAIPNLFIAIEAWFLLQIIKNVMQSQRGHMGVHEAFA